MSEDVVIETLVDNVVVEEVAADVVTVEVSTPGPQGPVGPVGPRGPGPIVLELNDPVPPGLSPDTVIVRKMTA